MITTPTTQQLADDLVADIQSSLGQTVPLLPKAFIRVTAKAAAGAVVTIHKYASWAFLQLFTETASYEETTVLGVTFRPLVYLGRRAGVGDPYAATQWEGTITVAVTNQTGTLAAGSQLTRAGTNVIYSIVAPVPLNSSSVVARVKAI